METPVMRAARATLLASISLALAADPASPAWAQVPPVERPATQPTAQSTTQPVAAAPSTQPAQAVIASVPPTTQPSAAPPATQPVPASASDQSFISITTTPAGGIVLNFKDASIEAVLDQLSEVARFIIVKETKIEGRATLLSKQPVSPDQAVSLLNTVLKSNGYAAIQMGRILKIVPRDKAKRSNIPVRTGSDPAHIEVSDELITQIIPLRFVDAAQLKQDLTPLFGADAECSANAASNSLILTDSSANIHRIAQIISALDTQLATAAEVKVFQLKYASAAGAARLILEIFRDEANPQTPQQGGGGRMQMPFGGRGGFPGGGFPGGGPGAGASGQGVRKTVRLTASSDDRTNTLVVSGLADTLKVVADVVKELDSDPSADEKVFIYSLKNGQAANLESVVNSIFGGTSSGGYRSTGSSQYNRAQQRTSGSMFGSGGSAFGSRTGTSGTSRMGGGNSTFGSNRTSAFGQARTGGFAGGLSSNARATAANLSGQVYAVADPDTNSLLIMTNPKNIEQVKEVLAELDRPLPQVLIKVLIAEVTHDDSRDLGAEFSVLNIRANGLGSKVGTDFGVANQSGGLVARVLENDFTAALRALETTGKLDVLSRPYILASDNQLASITVGQRVPFITASRTTDTGQTINTINYDDIGIILDVTPHINPEGLVIMDVAPEISSLTGTTVPISETVSAPVFAKRSAQTRVSIQNGQTIVIGGLMEDRKTDTVDKVPVIGDIPLLGALFQRSQVKKSKTELLIFLTPQVAPNTNTLQAISHEEEKDTKLVPGAVDRGAYDDQMKAMRRGATTQPTE